MPVEAQPTRLFKIEDGETHYVSAYDHKDALQLMADAFFDGNLEEYKEDQEPTIEWADMTKPLRVSVSDEVSFENDYPSGTHFEAHVVIPARLFNKLDRGIVSSTCYP